MNETPNAERIQIALFGVRNAGKSSLINAIAGRPVAIVSDVAGTTTDPVSKAMELGDLGPVTLTDTAGLDDVGELGRLRVEKSLKRLSWADIVVLATPLNRSPDAAEVAAYRELAEAGKPVLVVGTFSDRPADDAKRAWLQELSGAATGGAFDVVKANGASGDGVGEIKSALIRMKTDARVRLGERTPLDGLVEEGDIVLLVTPIDSAAPKGRLILPEAETLRDALDKRCIAVVAREHEVAAAYETLSRRPRLVVTDSQAFGVVAAALPPDQMLTSFSILFARKKGELQDFSDGIVQLKRFSMGRAETSTVASPLRLLSVEACTHNRTHEDIATVQIPRLLSERSGRSVQTTVVREIPDGELAGRFDLAVTCGGCMVTRGRNLVRMDALCDAGIPTVNFGLFLAWANGVLDRAIAPFSDRCVSQFRSSID